MEKTLRENVRNFVRFKSLKETFMLAGFLDGKFHEKKEENLQRVWLKLKNYEWLFLLLTTLTIDLCLLIHPCPDFLTYAPGKNKTEKLLRKSIFTSSRIIYKSSRMPKLFFFAFFSFCTEYFKIRKANFARRVPFGLFYYFIFRGRLYIVISARDLSSTSTC